jgi:hypothetical protein
VIVPRGYVEENCWALKCAPSERATSIEPQPMPADH